MGHIHSTDTKSLNDDSKLNCVCAQLAKNSRQLYLFPPECLDGDNNVVVMFSQRCTRWANITATMSQHFVFAGTTALTRVSA